MRAHSNVQGDRTIGIGEKTPASLIDALEVHCGLAMPRGPGCNTGQSLAALEYGEVDVFIALGVHIGTKLNRCNLVVRDDALILSCLGRTEFDRQLPQGLPQTVSV